MLFSKSMLPENEEGGGWRVGRGRGAPGCGYEGGGRGEVGCEPVAGAGGKGGGGGGGAGVGGGAGGGGGGGCINTASIASFISMKSILSNMAEPSS